MGDCINCQFQGQVNDVWIYATYTPAAATGACCTAQVCSIATEAACTGGGGTYQGDSTDCDPDPCDTALPSKIAAAFF